MGESHGIRQIAAPLFVFLWSTGFIGAKYGLPYAEPMTFLTLRFALAAAALGLWGWMAGELRDGGPVDPVGAVIVGVLMHALYLGGVFTAIWLGVGAALTALIVGLQPIATALLARPMLGEALRPRQWAGMALGLGGVALVVGRKLELGAIDVTSVLLCFLALISISFASILQKKRAVTAGLVTDSAIQFAAAGLVTGAAAMFFEERVIHWTPEFALALGWMVAGLSLGAISLYYLLLRKGEAAATASLFFLVPGVTALMAVLVFDEGSGWAELLGVGAATLGVRLVTQPAQAPLATASR
ncbi:DMT family transporter [Pikeienuella piscinae]|uniref:DMT family transporter n=1 Tax=Pikeienuella piscinae TaxID=2748098 RepID=A0A7L5C581_9RHOB|nr:DMT family transporter [Pikeienuella piscinae]QIE57119.1 DMT family transporter [Pikeienuella piscinae]